VADYTLSVARSARKDLLAMDRGIAMRIISEIDDQARTVDVSMVRHRRDAYRL
jgi:hypothetical protein